MLFLHLPQIYIYANSGPKISVLNFEASLRISKNSKSLKLADY